MCCSWTIAGTTASSGCGGSGARNHWQQDMSYASNVVLAEHIKHKIRRDLSRWSRKLLLCMGLENIGKHIVGDSKWEKLYDGCPSSGAAAHQDQEDTSGEFETQTGEGIPSCPKSPLLIDSKEGPPISPSMQVDAGDDRDDVGEEMDAHKDNECLSRNGKESDAGGEDNESIGDKEEEKVNDEEKISEMSMQEEFHDTEGQCEINLVKAPLRLSPTASEKSNEHEMAEGNGEKESQEEEKEIRRSGSGHQSPMSTTTSAPGGMKSDFLDRGADSPNSGSEAAQSTEEKGSGGGALVDNLFQILPYWYFLNRAFGMPGGPEAGLPQSIATSMIDEQADLEDDEEDDGGGSSIADGPGGHDSGRGSASSPFGTVGNHNSTASASQKLNSLLLLESLRQQLQNQGQQGLLSQEQIVQQQLRISELLTKMSTGSNADMPPWSILQKGGPTLLTDLGPSSGPLSRPGSADHQDADDQPLDLTSCRPSRETEKHALNFVDYPGNSASFSPLQSNSPFVLDEQTSKVFRSNPRSSKGYTAQELQAALHDIQSGKLGTRRAAVIYGIPRSTLRNKVYKLGKDRGRLFNNAGLISNQNLHPNNNNNNIPNNNNNIKDAPGTPSHLSRLSYLQGFAGTGNYIGGAPRGGNGVPLRYNNADEDEEEATPQSSAFHGRRAPPSLFSMGNGGASPPKSLPGSQQHVSSLSQLISKHSHPQRTSYHPAYQSTSMDVAMLEESSCHSDDQGPISASLMAKDTWKYALNRQEEQQHHQLLSQRQAVTGVNQYQRHGSHHQSQNHGSGGDDASSSLDLGKKSRPKRGKYRNYDREALVKAVRAVQNGEMSVHRAGSFFGVPHSTLEYKVKERHLLRRPKRKDVTSPLSQAKSSSPESSSLDAAPPTRQPSAFSKVSASAKTILNNNNNTPNETSALHHPYLFPLASDLRESLSRYLNQENNNKGDDDRASTSELMDTGSSVQNDHDEDEEEDVVHPLAGSQRLHQQLTQSSASSRKGSSPGSTALSLEGLIGSRLSNLFQLNDILLRGGNGNPDGDRGCDTRPENLLDLTKK